MSVKKIDPGGAQPTDPPWARLLFLVVQGRDGQWWRAILLVVPLLVLVIALVLLVGLIMIAALPPLNSWISGATGAGWLIGALAWYRRRRDTVSRAGTGRR